MSKKEHIKLVTIGEVKPTGKVTPAPKLSSGDIDFDKFVQEAMAIVFKQKDK